MKYRIVCTTFLNDKRRICRFSIDIKKTNKGWEWEEGLSAFSIANQVYIDLLKVMEKLKHENSGRF